MEKYATNALIAIAALIISVLLASTAFIAMYCIVKEQPEHSSSSWEKIHKEGPSAYRTPTPYGWIVTAGGGICYVEDQNHEWSNDE